MFILPPSTLNIYINSAIYIFSFERMNQFVLSTSTLSTDTIYFGGFGSVIPDGFGIGYNVTDEKLGAVAVSYKVGRFLDGFRAKFKILYKLIQLRKDRTK